jgi:hypothetical protein
MRYFWIYALPALACSGKTSTVIPSDTASDVVDTVDTDDLEDPGQDDDGDGFTVEDGDCDDTDPWTNPAMDEEAGDGIDNDCDGRIDEEWSGVDVSRINPSGRSSIATVDIIGNITNEVTLSEGCVPTYLDHGTNGGWVISGLTNLTSVTASGECTVLADFEEDENPIVRGVLTHPDGYYLASRESSLIAVYPDGRVEVKAEWSIDLEAYDITVWSIALDLRTNEIGLFGLYGGFATYSDTEGLVFHKKADVENWDGLYAYAGAAMDGGGWYSLVFNGETGEVSIGRYNFSQGDWVEQVTWTRDNIFPWHMTTNGDYEEFYITANAATYHTIWRARSVDGSVDDLFKSDSMPGYEFQGIVSNY